VWGEAQALLEELQMLRARVQEHRRGSSSGLGSGSAASHTGLLLGSGEQGAAEVLPPLGGAPAAAPPPAAPRPALLVLPLTCGHNLPWQPAESAMLACALREAFPALCGGT